MIYLRGRLITTLGQDRLTGPKAFINQNHLRPLALSPNSSYILMNCAYFDQDISPTHDFNEGALGTTYHVFSYDAFLVENRTDLIRV